MEGKINNKTKLIVLIILLVVLIFFYIGLIIYNYVSLKKYDTIVYPNISLDGFDMSGYSFDRVKDKLTFYNDYILDKKVTFKVNNKEYQYSYKDLGLVIDMDKTINEMIKCQSKLSYPDKLKLTNGNKTIDLGIVYAYDEVKSREFLNNLSGVVKVDVVNGYFDTSNGVKYVDGVDGFSLNVDNSLKSIKTAYKNGINEDSVIELVGDIVTHYGNDSYKTIDTMTSSFSTPFVPNTYLRNINLNNALGLINGTVVEPGEVFSYCREAGPFNRSGYVFYYEFVGNGVCQIATTTYDTALLGGLEIVKRYPHDKKSLYVDGGLDATVASYSSGWCVDMQFKNTYKYPIYIKAYSSGARAYVEFWSNSNAKEGKTYSLESVQIGARGYKSYRHTFKDGVEIAKDEIATTWYPKE